MVKLNHKYQQKISSRSPACARWLIDLPTILENIAQKWQLTILEPFPHLSYNYVTTVQLADRQTAVLKIYLPDDLLWYNEVEALRTFGGHGAVELYNYDYQYHALLLAYIHPAQNLNTVSDQVQATQVVAKLIQQLQKNPPLTNNLPQLSVVQSDFADYLHKYQQLATPPIPFHKVHRAQHTLLSLCASSSHKLVLHADLHQQNILFSTAQGWLAVDPKGYIGDPYFETGAYLRNNLLKYPDPAALTMQRIQILSEVLNFSSNRILSWAYTQAVLAACWCLQEQDPCYQEYLKVSDIFESLLPSDH